MKGIDANIILRYLTNDVPDQAEKVEKLLLQVETEKVTVYLSDIILADIVWTLEKYYKQPKSQVHKLITAILSLRGLHFSDKNLAFEALDVYVAQNVDWSDAFAASQMLKNNITEIYSFDKHFSRIAGIKRIEP